MFWMYATGKRDVRYEGCNLIIGLDCWSGLLDLNCMYHMSPPNQIVACPDYFRLAGKYSGELPTPFWFQYFEITVTSRQLDSEFKSALVTVNSEL